MKGLLVSFVSFLFISGSLAAEELSPNQWLEKMSRSHRELSYQGLFTYEQADAIQTMRIYHALINGEEFERLERLNSKALNVVRKGHGPRCMHVGEKLVRLLKENQSTAGVAHFYDFSVVGNDRVAGRPVVELAVMPRDKHRFGHRLSLDQETGLMLRSIQYSVGNNVLERFQFVEIDFDAPLTEQDFQGSKNRHQVKHIAPLMQQDANYTWRLSWKPGGFKASPQPVQDGLVESRTYTDGLAVFSVFVEPHQTDSNRETGVQGRAQRGATMAYSRAFQLNGQPHRVTVVGEIPQSTAERIAASVVSSG